VQPAHARHQPGRQGGPTESKKTAASGEPWPLLAHRRQQQRKTKTELHAAAATACRAATRQALQQARTRTGQLQQLARTGGAARESTAWRRPRPRQPARYSPCETSLQEAAATSVERELHPTRQQGAARPERRPSRPWRSETLGATAGTTSQAPTW
jgi:hypothetical protein